MNRILIAATFVLSILILTACAGRDKKLDALQKETELLTELRKAYQDSLDNMQRMQRTSKPLRQGYYSEKVDSLNFLINYKRSEINRLKEGKE